MNEVESVQLIDRETGLREFRESSGFGSAIDYLQTNPLPDVLIVVPVSEFRSYERAQRLLTVLEQEREVSSARLDLQWLQRLQAIVRVVENSLAALAILLSLAVVLIVGKHHSTGDFESSRRNYDYETGWCNERLYSTAVFVYGLLVWCDWWRHRLD